MEDENIIEEESRNMIPEDSLKRRLAEQTRKHEKAMREMEDRIRKEYENNKMDNSISTEAAKNVIYPNQSINQAPGYIKEEDLPSILAKAEDYRRQRDEEERKRRQLEEENMASVDNMEKARQSIVQEVEKDPEFKEQLRKHGDVDTLNEIENSFYEMGISPQHAPRVIKNLFTSEDKLAKFKDPSAKRINKKQILLDILLQNAEDNLSNSLPHKGGEFMIKGSSQVNKDPSKMNTSEYRKYVQSKGLYKTTRK